MHNPQTGEVKVYDLDSHSNTEKALTLDVTKWREGHYLSDSTVIARVLATDEVTEAYAVCRIRQSYPTFVDFFAWALRETKQKVNYTGSLYLNGLTSADRKAIKEKFGK